MLKSHSEIRSEHKVEIKFELKAELKTKLKVTLGCRGEALAALLSQNSYS